MNIRPLLFFSIAFLLFGGCAEKNLAVIPLEEIPAALRRTFSGAQAEIRKQVELTATAIQERQFAVASIQLPTLAALPNMSREQRDLLSQAHAAVNEQLRAATEAFQATAAADGTKPSGTTAQPAVKPEEAAAAAAVLHHYQQTK